jgi:hypothetical protein
MKCNMLKDLLPSYIEGLTSKESNEEIEKHFENCQECRICYQEMTGEIPGQLYGIEVKEIDYLKKIRQKYFRILAFTAGGVAVVLLILVKLFVLGFPAVSKDMDMTYQVKDNFLKIDFQLKNNHALTRRNVEPQFIYNDKRKIIGIEYRYKPVWVFNNPFDDVGTNFSLGTEIPHQDSEEQYTITLIIEYADKVLTFVNGELS